MAEMTAGPFAEEPVANYLDEFQMARVQALMAGRECLADKNLFGSSKVGPHDLITLAQYVMFGSHPDGDE